MRRNRRHLIPTKEPFHVAKDYSQPLYSEGTSNQPQYQATPQSEPPPPPAPWTITCYTAINSGNKDDSFRPHCKTTKALCITWIKSELLKGRIAWTLL